jgi:AcrR family transcriptional regulator
VTRTVISIPHNLFTHPDENPVITHPADNLVRVNPPPSTPTGDTTAASRHGGGAAVATDGRTANAERTKAALLDAALTEFAERGLAGARVAEIAQRAGVNKQLISYHFGGKQGLYDAIFQLWEHREQGFREEAESLEDLAVRYLREALADPRWAKLAARTMLDGSTTPDDGATNDDGTTKEEEPGQDLEDLRTRQRAGELAEDLDPQAVMLAITGMVTAPLLYSGATPPANYEEQLRLIVRKLRQ